MRNYKTEMAVGTHLKEKFPGITWAMDKQVEDGQSKRRPDLLFDMGSHVVIVEVDFHQPQHVRPHLRAQTSYGDFSGFEPSSPCDD